MPASVQSMKSSQREEVPQQAKNNTNNRAANTLTKKDLRWQVIHGNKLVRRNC